MSRREMLEHSMFAATVAAAAAYVPEARAAVVENTSPNSKIRVAVIGVNGRGGEHLRGYLARPDCDVVAICDADEKVGMTKGVPTVEKARGMKPKFYQDLRKLLEDKDVDAVSIATPNHWHSLAAIWAIQAGKDVYVEKPISHNVLEGRRLVQCAAKHKKIVQCGTQSRSHKAQQDLVKYIQDGKLGEMKLARGLCYKPRASIGPRGTYDIPESVNYDLWFGPAQIEPLTRPKFHYDWHWQWNCGNGDSGNQGIHQMDIARWGLGANDIGTGVYSYGGRVGYIDAGDTPNTQISVHEFAGGKRIIFETRGLNTNDFKGVKIGCIFQGTDGYGVSTSSYGLTKVFDNEGKEITTFKGGDSQDHFDNFIEGVRSRDDSKLNGKIIEGHLSSALCHTANISYRIGQEATADQIKSQITNAEELDAYDRMSNHLKDNGITMESAKLHHGPHLTSDPVHENFVGEHAAEANKLITREYRAPYLLPAEADL
jgi:predicted dehydrogenase